MKTFTQNALRISSLGSALLLGACMVAEEGKIDGKIDSQSVGLSLASSYSSTSTWSTSVVQPGAAANGLTQMNTKVGGLQKQAALVKRSDLGVKYEVLFSDTGKGLVTLTGETRGLLNITLDTVLARWDEKSKDTIKDNENIIRFKRVVTKLNGDKTEVAEFADADGDSLITPQGNGKAKATMTYTKYDGDIVESGSLIVGAGDDNNFDNEADNTIYKAESAKHKGSVVVSEGMFLDADNDGVIVDNTKDCVVKAKFWELNPKDKPLVKKATAEAVMKVFAHKAGDEPISFKFEEEMRTGRINKAWLKNEKGGEEITRGDTMKVYIESTVPSADQEDTLKYMLLELTMNPGQDLKSDKDDSVYAIKIKAEKKIGLEAEAEFEFISDKAILSGTQPTAGKFKGKVTYVNGTTLTVEGSFSPDGFSSTLTGPEGNTLKVEYNLKGDVVAETGV